MSDHEIISTESSGDGTAGEQRRPYQKPSFRYEQVFETMALVCGKIAGTSASCNSVKLAS